MKKYLVLCGAAILVMALASPSMAQFKSWGHIEIQTIWEYRPDFNTGQPWQFDAATRSTNRDVSWRHVAERYRFYLQYGDPKTVRAVLGFEADSTDWGEAAGGGTAGNNTATVPDSNVGYNGSGQHIGVYRADQVQLEVKHAYLDFTIPNTPVMLTAGVMPFDIGGRMFMNNDSPGAILTANFAPHRVRAFWWRENDANRFSYAVNDTYGLIWDMTKQLYNIFAFGAYKNDLFTGQVGSYSYPAVTTTTGTSAAFPGTVNTSGNFSANGGVWAVNPAAGNVSTMTYVMQLSTPANKYNDHPWWIGVGGGFRPGNWDLSAEFIYLGGKREFTQITTAGAPSGDSDYEAYSAEAYIRYRLGPGLFVGVEGYYSSGLDADNPTKIKQYQVPTVSEGQSNFGNDRTVFMWMNAAQMGYYHERNFSIVGFWYGRANLEYSPVSWLRMNFNYLYIGDNNKGTPGTGYSPLTRLLGAKQVNVPAGATQNKDLSFVGHEINLITTLRIYQNFDYNIGLAAFIPGDMYGIYNTAGTKTFSPDTAYAVNTKLIYAF